MAKSKKGFLPRIEILIVLIFFVSFIIWAVSKCSDKQVSMQNTVMEDSLNMNEVSPVDSIRTALTTNNSGQDSMGNNTLAQNSNSATNRTKRPTPTSLRTRLYVTLDGLNMRTGPHLDSTVLLKIPLHDQVEFLDEVTDFTQRISLGTTYAEEPWIKVKHARGYVGWVYGAGVHYHKAKPTRSISSPEEEEMLSNEEQ